MKSIYKVTGMHCESCAMLIEEELRDAGIVGQCSYAKSTLTVDQKIIDIHKLSEIISKIGYSLKPIANEK